LSVYSSNLNVFGNLKLNNEKKVLHLARALKVHLMLNQL